MDKLYKKLSKIVAIANPNLGRDNLASGGTVPSYYTTPTVWALHGFVLVLS